MPKNSLVSTKSFETQLKNLKIKKKDRLMQAGKIEAPKGRENNDVKNDIQNTYFKV